MRPTVSVVIPVRQYESFRLAAESLMRQSYQDFEIVVRVDPGHGQSWTRNRAAESARGKYLLFSDSDIEWHPAAITTLLRVFHEHAVPAGWKRGYAYCSYALTVDGREVQTICDRPWDWETLQRIPYISTMSLVPRDVFMRFMFDEEFHRLEDWELWLRMGASGYAGTWCGSTLFTTPLRSGGVSYGGPVSHEAAESMLRRKHPWTLWGETA